MYKSHSPDFNIHNLEWFGDFDEKHPDASVGTSVYVKMNITESNFLEELHKTLYLKKFLDASMIPGDAAYIKFSYYSEHDTPVLIEEENVAIIQDGKVGEDAVSVISSISDYQFLCGDDKVPFDDNVEVDLLARQGAEQLFFTSVKVESEETDFKTGVFSCEITGEKTKNPKIIFRIRSVQNSSGGRLTAPERMNALITVKCIDVKENEIERQLWFKSVCVATGVYIGAFDTVEPDYLYNTERNKTVLKADWHSGDYFLKIGATDNRYEPPLITGVRYKWTGSGWVEDSSEAHLMDSFNDMISYAEGLQTNEDTVKVFKSLTTAILQVGKMFANEITLMKVGEKGGLIKSNNYNGTIKSDNSIDTNHFGSQGWAIDYNGQADFVGMHATGGEFTNATVKGSMKAKVFHFDQTFDYTDEGWRDEFGNFIPFLNGDMWLIN